MYKKNHVSNRGLEFFINPGIVRITVIEALIMKDLLYSTYDVMANKILHRTISNSNHSKLIHSRMNTKCSF